MRSDADYRTVSLPIARLLVGGAALMVLAAGLLLWWRQGGAVFSDLVQAAYAWCF